MSKLRLMDYEVVSEMVSIGVTPEEYLPRIYTRSAPSLLIKELMKVGVERGFVLEEGSYYLLNCSEDSEQYNEYLEYVIQTFRRFMPLTQNLIESYSILSKREFKGGY